MAKSHASITAPLKKMVANLKSHMDDQQKQIYALETQQKEIQKSIDNSAREIEMSRHTTSKINELLGAVDPE